MPSFPRNVLLPLCTLLAVLLCSTASAQDEEARQKQLNVLSLDQTPAMTRGTQGAPEKPQDLQVFPGGFSSVMVLWTPSVGADHYNVFVEGEDMDDTTTSPYYVWENLEPCTTYTFGVTAVSAEGDMSEPALAEGETSVGPPPAPQNLQVDSYTNTTVTLKWEEPDTLCDILNYRVKYRKDDGSETQDTQVSETTFTVTDLLPDSTYTFEVYAATSYGEGAAATVQQTTAANEGGPPEDLVAEGVSTSVINVSWSAPYTKPLYYLVQAPPCMYNEETVNGLQYQITGREPCQRCFITVTSYYSDSIKYPAQTEASSLGGAPPPPKGCSFDVQQSSIKVNWERPTTNCLLGVYSVDWTRKTLWGDGEEEIGGDNTTGTTYFLYNPVPYSHYSFEISASIDGVFGSPTSCSVTSLESPPGPPVLLTVDSVVQGEALVTWDTPAEENGVIVKYAIFVDEETEPRKEVNTDIHETSISNLEPCTNVNISVKALNGAGWGERSEVKGVTIVDDEGAPEDLVAEGVSPSVINVSWSAPYTKPLYYLVQAPPCMYNEETVNGLQYQITGLEPCQRCFITVTSYYSDSIKYPAQTDASSLSGAPPPPKGCSVDVQQSSIKGNWERPTSNCLLGVYSVDWTRKTLWGDGEEEIGGDNTTGTSYIIYNPVPYSNYSFEISASIDGVFGSPTSCSVTSLESLPGPPVLLTVESVVQGEALVTWNTPFEENGVIANYSIFVDDETAPRKVVNADIHQTSINNLEPCRDVNISVKALNGAGWGERSEVKGVTVVDDILPDKLNCSAPGRVVEVCWEPYSSTCPVSQYNLYWEGDVLWSGDGTDSNSTTLEWSDTVICYNISATPYTEYHVLLSVGAQHDTIECWDTTPMAAPGPPTLEEVQADNLAINVTWKEPEEKNGIIDCYQVQWWNDSSVLNLKKTDDNSTFSYQILGLSCGNTVTVTVSAKTTDVTEFGEKSSPQTAYLINSVSTLNCSSTTPGQISLTWTLEHSGCPLEFYNLTWTYESLWSDETGAGWKLIDGQDTSDSVTQLPPYASVSVELYVDNTLEHVGCAVTTLEEPASAPTDLEQVAMDVSSVTVQWSFPEFVQGKLIVWHLNWTSVIGHYLGEENIADPEERMFKIESLEPSEVYNVYVMAVNGAGAGEAAVVEASTEYVP